MVWTIYNITLFIVVMKCLQDIGLMHGLNHQLLAKSSLPRYCQCNANMPIGCQWDAIGQSGNRRIQTLSPGAEPHLGSRVILFTLGHTCRLSMAIVQSLHRQGRNHFSQKSLSYGPVPKRAASGPLDIDVVAKAVLR